MIAHRFIVYLVPITEREKVMMVWLSNKSWPETTSN